MVGIAWKKLLIAGVTGLACGKGYMWLRQYPDTVRPIVYCSALSGVSGVVLGLGVAVYRDLSSHVYALSTGANFALVTATFLGVRHIILRPLSSTERATPLTLRQAEFVSSGASGGIAITVATTLSKRSFRSIMISGSVGVGLGLLSQLLYLLFEHWRQMKAIEIHHPELSGREEKTAWTLKLFEERFMTFWHKRSRAIQADTDIVVLSESIKDEERRIKELDQLLKDEGVVPIIKEDFTKDRAAHAGRDNSAIARTDLKLSDTR